MKDERDSLFSSDSFNIPFHPVLCYLFESITNQRSSAWHCYIGRLISKGMMRFSTSWPGKTNEYFGTKLGRRDYVGKIYKLTKFGADRSRNGASTWW